MFNFTDNEIPENYLVNKISQFISEFTFYLSFYFILDYRALL